MDILNRIVKFCKTKTFYYKSLLLEEIRSLRQDPLEYFMLCSLKNFEWAGKMFLSPVRAPEDRTHEPLRLIPSRGIHLYITDTLCLFFFIRLLIHFTMIFRQGLVIFSNGSLTVDGIVFLLIAACGTGVLVIFWSIRKKRNQFSWMFNQFCQLQRKVKGTDDRCKRSRLVSKRNPVLIFFIFGLKFFKFLIPVLTTAVELLDPHSPLLLPSFVLLESEETREIVYLCLLLVADLVIVEIALVYFVSCAILLTLPLLLATFYIRSIKFKSFGQLNWRQRRSLYSHVEYLYNSLAEEIRSLLPICWAYLACVPAACIVSAIKMTNMETTYAMMRIGVMLIAVFMIIGPFCAMRISENLVAESASLLDELRVEATAELRRARLGVLLTNGRLIRQPMGSFKFIEAGTGLTFVAVVLDNVISGIFYVQSTVTSYFV